MSVLTAEELNEVIDIVWQTVFDLPVGQGEVADVNKREHCTAKIGISGAWNGAVHVRAEVAFLTRGASRMFSIQPEEVNRQDRIDTICELTNMLGGTVKCLLPESCDLTLPEMLNKDTRETGMFDWHYFNCAGYSLAMSVVGQVAEVPKSQAVN